MPMNLTLQHANSCVAICVLKQMLFIVLNEQDPILQTQLLTITGCDVVPINGKIPVYISKGKRKLDNLNIFSSIFKNIDYFYIYLNFHMLNLSNQLCYMNGEIFCFK